MKVHLFESDEPIQENHALVTLCGADVLHAAFVMMGDGDFEPSIHDLISSIKGLCPDCKVRPMTGQYLYAVREGEDG